MSRTYFVKKIVLFCKFKLIVLVWFNVFIPEKHQCGAEVTLAVSEQFLSDSDEKECAAHFDCRCKKKTSLLLCTAGLSVCAGILSNMLKLPLALAAMLNLMRANSH